MKRYIYVLFICLLWNCGGQQNFNNTFEEIIDCQDFFADIVDYRTEDLIIDDIIDTIIIVKLETKEESLLGSVKDIAISDDNIYILDDYNSIVIFDKSGTFYNPGPLGCYLAFALPLALKEFFFGSITTFHEKP